MTNRIGHGTVLSFAGSTAVIGEAISITPMEISADEIDITTYASTSKYREFMAGLINPGEISIECALNDTDEGQVEALAAVGGAAEAFVLTFPSASAHWDFSAFVKSYTHGAPMDDQMTATIVLKATGVAEFTVGS